MMMQYDVTEGGPMEASVVELSVHVLKLITSLLPICNKTLKKFVISLVVAP